MQSHTVRHGLISHGMVTLLSVLLPVWGSAQEPPPPAVTAPTSEGLTARLTPVGFGQLFTRYGHHVRAGERFQEVDLTRAELGGGFLYEDRHGLMINVEAIRSAGPRSAFGIDENSLVLRVKHAFGVFEPRLPFGALTVRGGLIPDVWIEVVERAYDLRGISPLGFESTGFYDTSDLGLSLSYAMFEERVELRLALTNGEGRNQVELNAGKNTTAALNLRQPLFAFRGAPSRLGLHTSYRDGSQGYASQRAHRLSSALTFEHPLLYVGAEYGRAWGVYDRGELEGQLLGGWASGALAPEWLGIYMKFLSFTPDLSVTGSQRTLDVGLYADLIPTSTAPRDVLGFPRLRLYLGYRRERADALAAPVAGVSEATDTHSVTLTLSARGMARPAPLP